MISAFSVRTNAARYDNLAARWMARPCESMYMSITLQQHQHAWINGRHRLQISLSFSFLGYLYITEGEHEPLERVYPDWTAPFRQISSRKNTVKRRCHKDRLLKSKSSCWVKTWIWLEE